MCERALKSSELRLRDHPIEFRNGRVFWSWQRDGANNDQVTGSSDFWCVRLPLATESGEWGWMNLYRPIDGPPLLLDMNYLTGLFRNQLSEAAERVFRPFAEPDKANEISMRVIAGKMAG